MDKIIIKGFKLSCRIGVTAAERLRPQTIEVDLEMFADVRKPAVSDKVADGIDYAAVASSLRALAQGSQFRLIERLAEEVARRVLSGFPVRAVRVLVRKKALPETDWAGVGIFREKSAGKKKRPGRG